MITPSEVGDEALTELHLHLDGCIRPAELLRHLAGRDGVLVQGRHAGRGPGRGHRVRGGIRADHLRHGVAYAETRVLLGPDLGSPRDREVLDTLPC